MVNRNKRGAASPVVPRSNANTAPPTPALDTAPKKAAVKDTMRVDTNVPIVGVDPLLLDRLSPSVRDVAQHAALLKSVLARLGPIYDLVEREASRMTEVSPFLAGRDQVDQARDRLTTDAQKREEKVEAVKKLIEAEKKKFVDAINERLETMIKEVVAAKVKERVKTQVAEIMQPYQKALLGNKGRTMRNKMFLSTIEAKTQNATIRSRFPQERITPIFRPISVAFQIQGSPTDSPSMGPVGGFNPSPSMRFPETFEKLIKLSLSDSRTLLKDYDIAEDVNDRRTAEETRLDNLNKLMVHFGIGYRLHPGPARKGPIITSLWDRR
jgi:hypothetical protein